MTLVCMSTPFQANVFRTRGFAMTWTTAYPEKMRDNARTPLELAHERNSNVVVPAFAFPPANIAMVKVSVRIILTKCFAIIAPSFVSSPLNTR